MVERVYGFTRGTALSFSAVISVLVEFGRSTKLWCHAAMQRINSSEICVIRTDSWEFVVAMITLGCHRVIACSSDFYSRVVARTPLLRYLTGHRDHQPSTQIIWDTTEERDVHSRR